jgi:hypothetical protein
MRKSRVAVSAVVVSILACTQLASGQNIGPATPDVVMQCFAGGEPSNACTFSCGSVLNQAPGEKAVLYPNVRRVEFLYKGSTGRVDGRSWVFIQYSPGVNDAKANVAALYIGPNIYCDTGLVVINGVGATVEMRVTKFSFD